MMPRTVNSPPSVTIIDANVTTLITAIVLYIIGTDQVKGFAVALTVGLSWNLFTAITVSRLIFEVTENEELVDKEHLKDIIREYRRQGFKTAIDDFGAGYSDGSCNAVVSVANGDRSSENFDEVFGNAVNGFWKFRFKNHAAAEFITAKTRNRIVFTYAVF